MRRLQSLDWKDDHFVFFIDGLDEYEGDDAELADVVLSLQGSKHLKLCVSSRPHNVFKDSFGEDPCLYLTLHDSTKDDISRYVSGMIQENSAFPRLCDRNPETPELVNMVVDQAQGVFLWVFLVVRSLIRGLSNADSVSVSKKRLMNMPKDLEQYFDSMLGSIEPVYREDSSRMLLSCIASMVPIPLGESSLQLGLLE